MTESSPKPIDKRANAPDVALQKKRLRAEIKSRLKNLTYNRRQIADALYDRLVNVAGFRAASVVGLYVDFNDEAPTRPLIPRLFEASGERTISKVAVPYCVGDDMRFYKLRAPTVDGETREPVFSDLEPFPPFGILEPSPRYRDDPQYRVEPKEFDCLIVPGLAFDFQGRRLGRGAGYYDRYLPRLRPDALVIGVCFDEQLVDKAPTDERDVGVDAVVTPTRTIYVD